MRYYVDDGILAEVQWWPNGRRCVRAVQSLTSDHFRLLGVRGASDPPLLSASKITNWDTRLEVLGWLGDTEALTVTSPPYMRLKLRLLLLEWPPTRTYASAKQVSQLAGVLMHISFAVRRGSLLVHGSLASAGMPRIEAGDHFAGQMANPRRRVALGPEFHAGLEFWRWFVDKGVDARGRVLSVPMYHFLERSAQRTFFSDASKAAVGGYCLETGVCWRYDFTAQEQSRFCGSSKCVRGVDDLSMNVLELFCMVVSAFILVSSCADRPSATGDCALLETTRPLCIGCGVVGGDWNRVPVPSCVSSAFSKCHLDGISRRRMCVVSTTLPPTASLAGIAAPFLIICAPFVPTSRGRFGNWRPSAFPSVLRCWPQTHATRRCGLD